MRPYWLHFSLDIQLDSLAELRRAILPNKPMHDVSCAATTFFSYTIAQFEGPGQGKRIAEALFHFMQLVTAYHKIRI